MAEHSTVLAGALLLAFAGVALYIFLHQRNSDHVCPYCNKRFRKEPSLLDYYRPHVCEYCKNTYYFVTCRNAWVWTTTLTRRQHRLRIVIMVVVLLVMAGLFALCLLATS